MTSSSKNNEAHIDWNGHQPCYQEPRRVENHDDCSLTSIETDYYDHSGVSSCSLSDEELNEIMMSLELLDMFEDQSDFSGIERHPLEYERNVPHKGGPFNGLSCVSENVCKDNFDLTEEDTELIKKAANVLRHEWENRSRRRDQRLLWEANPSFTDKSGIKHKMAQ
eukprot:3838494-Ditylum_brightwellii.AAC.1